MLSLNANPQGNATPLGGGRGGGVNTSWGEGTLWSAFLFLNFNWRLITILWWFLPYIDMNQPQMYMCSPSENDISIPLLSFDSRCYFMINKSWKTENSCMHSFEENQRMQKLALKNQHFSIPVLNSQLMWVKLNLEVKGFCRITHIMLKLVLEPIWMPEHISYKLIFITSA